jgi:carboxylesterase
METPRSGRGKRQANAGYADVSRAGSPVTGRVRPGAAAFRFGSGSTGGLLLHGFTGSPASLRPLGEHLAANGIVVACPRLPGHGTDDWNDLSGSTAAGWLAAAEEALAGLSGCDGVVVVGLSMGGALALQLAAVKPDAFRGVVLINPYVRDPRLAAAPVARLFVRSVKGIGNDIHRPGQDEVCNERIPMRTLAEANRLLRSARAALPQLRLPLLVFSSPQDHTVDPGNSRLVMERAGSESRELIGLPSSYHVATLDYDADAIFERTLAFVRASLAA